MKTLINRLLQGRIARWGFLAALLIAVGASVGWMNQGHYQLGGGWIFSAPDTIYTALQIPLDPAGRTAAIRVHAMTYDLGTAGLVTAFGADTLSESTGEAEMTGRNTAKWTLVAYGQAQGNPPQIRAICVSAGTLQFTGPNSLGILYTLKVYAATADADGDGFPDPDTLPAVTIPGLTATAKRVPVP